MRHTLIVIAALCAMLPAGMARAAGPGNAPAGDGALAEAGPGTASALALPMVDPLALPSPVQLNVTACEAAGAMLATEGVTRLEAIRYYPRGSHPAPPPYHEGGAETQFHMGFFDPNEFSSAGVLFGFRSGVAVDRHLQFGVGVDWRYKSENQTSIVMRQPLPTGGFATVTQVFSQSSTNLVPMLAYIQIGAGRDRGLMPFAGAGLGYEVYFVNADDFYTGSHFDAEYGGFGWQAWGGLQVPMSYHSRLVVEGFMNQAELGRDVSGPGVTYRETVNLDGAGMRFGVNWGF